MFSQVAQAAHNFAGKIPSPVKIGFGAAATAAVAFKFLSPNKK